MGNVLECRRLIRVIAERLISSNLNQWIRVLQICKCQLCQVPINLKVKLESYNSKSSSGGHPTVTVCCRLSDYCSTAASASDVLKRRSES